MPRTEARMNIHPDWNGMEPPVRTSTIAFDPTSKHFLVDGRHVWLESLHQADRLITARFTIIENGWKVTAPVKVVDFGIGDVPELTQEFRQ